MKYVAYLVFVSAWVTGIALAKGFWWTAFSLIPLVAWINVAQWFLEQSVC